MAQPSHPKIVCLSGIYDQHYHDVRGEEIARELTTPYRRDVFRCLELASGREVIVLTLPPKASDRRTAKWLPAVETRFATHRQFFCANWDVPKLRVPLSWFFYGRHVLRHVQSGDLVVMDNYAFNSTVAARVLHIFRRVKFILIYLDGRHLIDRSWPRFLGWLAETGGRGLLHGALLSNPSLGKRLPPSIPTELVSGFVPDEPPPEPASPDKEVRFLYAGALDFERGPDLLLDALPYLPEQGWHLTIAGQGRLMEQVIRCVENPRWKGRVDYRPPMPPAVFEEFIKSYQVGLNCQRVSDPRSGVTFPSKVFSYLSNGLLVISSKAGCVEQVCGNACLYYDGETPQALAATMTTAIKDFSGVRKKLDLTAVHERYSFTASAKRVRQLLKSIAAFE